LQIATPNRDSDIIDAEKLQPSKSLFSVENGSDFQTQWQ